MVVANQSSKLIRYHVQLGLLLSDSYKLGEQTPVSMVNVTSFEVGMHIQVFIRYY